MKRLFLVPALLLLMLSSCKEDEEDVVIPEDPAEKTELKEQLQGEWSNNYRTTDFYNDAGEIAHKDTATVDVRFTFDGSNMDISHPGVPGKETLNYALPDSSAADYVVISKNGQVQDHWEITSINDSTMVWEKTVDYAGYQDENNNTVTSRKGVYSFEFKKM